MRRLPQVFAWRGAGIGLAVSCANPDDMVDGARNKTHGSDGLACRFNRVVSGITENGNVDLTPIAITRCVDRCVPLEKSAGTAEMFAHFE